MNKEVAKVETFYDDESACEMELISINANGLCKVRYVTYDMDVTVARHKNRVRPLNNAAREMLK